MTQSTDATGAGGEESRPDTDEVYLVVRNDEEQYSIWRADREPPAGWYREGLSGTRQQCLDHIGVIWTDMRPLSLRRRLAGADV
ncbi:MbtH family protein [Streptomyces griseoviridis]|uniref:MbtH family NRPS accessory protein n=2 Tax=Streptomyces TaxID=1883 RepID=A0A3Q9KXK9_STRGD|nr:MULTISPECIES: MbtH family NRPS accessory protein [Streptomyces]AZS89407.1 MbtH family NRPS accessory protein [Streptomyces griseoviridis]MDH6699323.1 MbtH protein [Streptomyces sp. MAA16]MDT0476608.1 MbtH family NRPS accessory protein [Streptomyces sp. DSM 41014]QCN90319.1 MbtH family protein [Streptomyces griseoviridis]